jgi:hypothetical protein
MLSPHMISLFPSLHLVINILFRERWEIGSSVTDCDTVIHANCIIRYCDSRYIININTECVTFVLFLMLHILHSFCFSEIRNTLHFFLSILLHSCSLPLVRIQAFGVCSRGVFAGKIRGPLGTCSACVIQNVLILLANNGRACLGTRGGSNESDI